MKRRILCITIATGILSACMAPQVQQQKWTVTPYSEVQHGMPTARAYYQLGRYFYGQGQDARAAVAFAKALAADPGYVDALNGLGATQARGGNLEEAIMTFQHVAKLAPTAAQSHNNLGYALFKSGRFDEAMTHLRRAQALERSNDYARANLALVSAALAEASSDSDDARKTASSTLSDTSTAAITTADRMESPARAQMASTPLRLEVSNGNGIRGMAGRFAARLSRDGQPVSRITNQPRFDVATTRIEYRPGFKAAALELDARFSLGATQVEARTVRQGSELRLILGHDMTAARRTPPPLATTR